jgi:preprotein translocase subunit SecG
VINRKKKITLVQLTIFLIASILLFNTYRDKNETAEQAMVIAVESETDTNNS